MDIVTVLLLVLALVVGIIIGFVVARQQSASGPVVEADPRALTAAREDAAAARTDAGRAREEANQSRVDLLALKAEVSQHLADKAELRALAEQAQRFVAEAKSETAQIASQVAAVTAQRDAAVEKAREQAEDRESLLNQFKVLSAESLENQSKQADAAAEQRLKATEQLVTPLTDGLKQMREKLQTVETDRARMQAEISEQVKVVRESGEAIRRETSSLSNALRTPQVRGAWGEQSLKRIVEISGMSERCDFDTQTSYQTEDGAFRPDLRVNLANDKVIFVDSKVPLQAALEAYNTPDEAAQKAHFLSFAKHVRTHIDQLSSKGYWQLDLGSPEFVVLYLPSDEIYRLALEQLPDLHDYASRKHIVLSSPGLLIPMLQIVANGWKQVSLAKTAQEVSALGRELYKRLATLGSHFDKLGRSLTASVKSYNSAVGTLETRVMTQARRFRDLEVTDEDLGDMMLVSESTRQIAVVEMINYAEERERERALLASDDVADVDAAAPSTQVLDIRKAGA